MLDSELPSNQPSERCLYLHCRKFIHNAHNTGMCVECAKGAIVGIKRYFRIRSMVGVGFMVLVFLIIPGLNALLSLNDVIRIPISIGYLYQGYMSINIWSFSAINALGIFGIVQVMIICYFLGFTKKVNFETGIQYKVDYSVKSDEIFYASAAQLQKGRSDSATRGGLVVVELAISLFTGPFFFAHGLYTLRKLSNYIN